MKVNYTTAKLAKEKGFDFKVRDYFITDGKLFEEDMKGNYNNATWVRAWTNYFNDDTVSAPSQSSLQKWLREKHDIHIHIRRENYFHRSNFKYYHYDISKGTELDITKQQDLSYNIMDECSQDIPGNHLDTEKYSKLIFTKKFAFKTYEKALEVALQKGLKAIIKEK